MVMTDNPKRHILQAAIYRIKQHRMGGITTRQAQARKRFSYARQRIRERVLDEFRLHEWPRFQMLHEIFTKNLGLPVPTLSVCGSGTAEIRFTKLLAYYFDSRNQHGLGGLLSRAVFENYIETPQPLPFDSCTAHTEVDLGVAKLSDGRETGNSLDILLEVGHHKILIEQKISSSEGKEQLSRYSKCMKEKFGNASVSCFFLTPDGHDGSGADWTPLSHRELFCRLSSVLDRHALSSVARHNLQGLLWDLMLGPLAQSVVWVKELRHQTSLVSKDYRAYIGLKKWLMEYGIGRDELRMLSKLIGG
jgi:hypothetical protein